VREIRAAEITTAVERLCVEANYYLPEDMYQALVKAQQSEESPLGREVLGDILKNAKLAPDKDLPICQDTGLAVLFVELGQEVYFADGDINEAINEGVRRGYENGFLRKSSVDDPFLTRINRGDNTPAVVHLSIVPGDQIKLTLAPKGGGSENMSALAMLTPAAGLAGMKKFVVETVEKAGANACPPLIVGVGVGGTMEMAALIAKKSLLRKVGMPNPNQQVAQVEQELLSEINALGIGPQGFGGSTTALAVHIETFPAHIASMPVAVNMQCHVARHKQAVL
jgi:fumarate hydratase subunit alpha